MNKSRLLLMSWLLALLAYLVPWAESNKGLHIGLDPNLAPFASPYLIGLVLGLIAIFAKAHRLLVAIIASVLMMIGVLCVVFWWYGLALHYVSTGGGVAELKPGVWFALIASLVHLGSYVGKYARLRS